MKAEKFKKMVLGEVPEYPEIRIFVHPKTGDIKKIAWPPEGANYAPVTADMIHSLLARGYKEVFYEDL